MFFIHAGFFIGGVASFGQMFVSQKNQWSRGVTKGDEIAPLPSSNAWMGDLFVGGEVRAGQYGLWSNSVGVAACHLKIQDVTKTVLDPKGDIVRSPKIGDSHTLYIDNSYLINARSTVGLMMHSCYFAAGVSLGVFKLSQTFNREPVFQKWTCGVGPTLSFKVDLTKNFRWVFYGDWLFFNTTDRPEVSFDNYKVTISRKPFMWRAGTGFEIHGSNIHEDNACAKHTPQPDYTKCPRYANLGKPHVEVVKVKSHHHKVHSKRHHHHSHHHKKRKK